MATFGRYKFSEEIVRKIAYVIYTECSTTNYNYNRQIMCCHLETYDQYWKKVQQIHLCYKSDLGSGHSDMVLPTTIQTQPCCDMMTQITRTRLGAKALAHMKQQNRCVLTYIFSMFLRVCLRVHPLYRAFPRDNCQMYKLLEKECYYEPQSNNSGDIIVIDDKD